MRHSNRKYNELRNLDIEIDVNKYAEGSCIITLGNTRVLCTASFEDNTPGFLRGKNKGWVTAEYAMLPRSTHSRIKRESQQGKINGRTHEIQRLIARSLRSVVDLKSLGERQIIVDCDVLQADGGTRTASITGGYIALALACKNLYSKRIIKSNPIIGQVAAISCGIHNGNVILDLDYEEDSRAETDANFVMNEQGNIIELQSTAEHGSFDNEQFMKMLNLAKNAISSIIDLQKELI
jgi:ribonuclease PH